MPHIPFALEEDLCGVLSPQLDRLVGSRSPSMRSVQLTQRPVGTVIPDFIFIRCHVGKIEVQGACNGLTALESWIVSTLLPGRPLSMETIARRLYTRANRITPSLLALRRHGILEERRSGEFALRRGVIPARCHVVAVEAKLRRWREALNQAVAYRTFANQAYVALPESIVAGNPTLHRACRARKVGVISVGGESARVAVEAPSHQARSPDWVWLLSRTVGVGRTCQS